MSKTYWIVSQLKAKDFPSFMRKIESLPDSPIKRNSRHAYIGRWVEVDPAGALAYVLADDDPVRQDGEIGSVFSALADIDPDAALKAAQKLTNVDLRQKATRSMLRALSRLNPEKALSILETLSDKRNIFRYQRTYITQWAGKDPASAYQEALRIVMIIPVKEYYMASFKFGRARTLMRPG